MSKYRLPVLHYLPAFEAAARHQSIKHAAGELHVTPSAVSRNIQRLERQLGLPLFERRHRGVAPTAEGEILLGAVEAGFSHIQQAIVQLSVSRISQRLVISVDPDFAALWLVPRLAQFNAAVPGILLEIRTEEGVHSLEDGRVHCAVHYFEADRPPDNGEILFRSRLFPVCAPALLARLPLGSPEDLSRHVLVYDRSRLEWQQYFRSASIKADLAPGPVLSSTALCMDAAARAVGVAMGDDFLAEAYLSEGRLVKPFDLGFMSRNAYYFIVPRGRSGHPAVGAFRAWLLRGISQVRSSPSTPRTSAGGPRSNDSGSRKR